MRDPDTKDKLQELSARIDAAKAAKDGGKAHQEEHYSQAQMGWRMVTELVAGLMIGFAIGYGLDIVFGTLPIMMVIFIVLGLVAGIRVMLRTAEEIQTKKHAAETAANDEGPEDGN
ncbi:MAG: AtpZ/AtpI family protein [Rhodobacteraceae bacterium]|nr:AtpZ/AtpI family protein [Paracoccaceae bacterium]